MERNGICLMVDILGFSSLIENLEERELDNRIKEWVELIKGLTAKFSLESFNLLSDTLFVKFPEPYDLTKVIAFSKELLEKSTSASIPLRGAVTYGEILTGDFIYGKAVIAAHRLEMNQKWIGITFDKSIPNIENYYHQDQLMAYCVPMKSGFVEVYPVLSWNVPTVLELTKCVSGPGLRDQQNRVNQNILEILTNTSIFKTQRNLKISQKDDFKNCGMPPSHFVEQLEEVIIHFQNEISKKTKNR